jgi:hypothetical protein
MTTRSSIRVKPFSSRARRVFSMEINLMLLLGGECRMAYTPFGRAVGAAVASNE